MGWRIVTTGEIAVAQTDLTAVNVQALDENKPFVGISVPDDSSIVGLAAIAPIPLPREVPNPVVGYRPGLPPALPKTTVFLASANLESANSFIAAVAPVFSETDTPATSVLPLNGNLVPQQNGIAVYQKTPPPGAVSIDIEGPPVYLYVLCSNPRQYSDGETILRYQVNSNPPYAPAGPPSDPSNPIFITRDSTSLDIMVLQYGSATQGLACSADGILAVADGSSIWLFDAVTGELTGARQIDLNEYAGVIGLPGWSQYAALALAFGPDGNLYVLVAQATIGATNPNPDSVAVLSFGFVDNNIAAVGAIPESGDPLLLNNTQIPEPAVALAVGGTAQNPIIYVVGASGTQNAILTFMPNGEQTINNFQPFDGGLNYCGPVLFNVYTLATTAAPFEGL